MRCSMYVRRIRPPLDEVDDAPVGELRNRHAGKGLGHAVVFDVPHQCVQLGQQPQADARALRFADVASHDCHRRHLTAGGVNGPVLGLQRMPPHDLFDYRFPPRQREELVRRTPQMKLADRLADELVDRNSGDVVQRERQLPVDVPQASIGRQDGRALVHVVEQLGHSVAVPAQSLAVCGRSPLGDDGHLRKGDGRGMAAHLVDNVEPDQIAL
jgi:hypothetical protein